MIPIQKSTGYLSYWINYDNVHNNTSIVYTKFIFDERDNEKIIQIYLPFYDIKRGQNIDISYELLYKSLQRNNFPYSIFCSIHKTGFQRLNSFLYNEMLLNKKFLYRIEFIFKNDNIFITKDCYKLLQKGSLTYTQIHLIKLSDKELRKEKIESILK